MTPARPMRSLVELSLVGERRRGHGSLYAALNRGRIDIDRLRTALARVPLPRAADGRIVLAVDVTCWLRPEAHTSPDRVLRHTYGAPAGRAGRDSRAWPRTTFDRLAARIGSSSTSAMVSGRSARAIRVDVGWSAVLQCRR